MPSFRFDKALGIERDIRARVEFKQIRSEIESKRQESEQAENDVKEIKNKLKSKSQENKQKEKSDVARTTRRRDLSTGTGK